MAPKKRTTKKRSAKRRTTKKRSAKRRTTKKRTTKKRPTHRSRSSMPSEAARAKKKVASKIKSPAHTKGDKKAISTTFYASGLKKLRAGLEMHIPHDGSVTVQHLIRWAVYSADFKAMPRWHT